MMSGKVSLLSSSGGNRLVCVLTRTSGNRIHRTRSICGSDRTPRICVGNIAQSRLWNSSASTLPAISSLQTTRCGSMA